MSVHRIHHHCGCLRRTTLHHNIVWGNKLYHEVYLQSSNTLAHRIQSGQHFVSNLIAYGHSNLRRWASVALLLEGQVVLRSSLPCFGPIHPVSGFKNVIRSFANQSLWVSLDYDDNGSWIFEGMLAQSLIIIQAERGFARSMMVCIQISICNKFWGPLNQKRGEHSVGCKFTIDRETNPLQAT